MTQFADWHVANIVTDNAKYRILTTGYSYKVPALSIYGERDERACFLSARRKLKKTGAKRIELEKI